MNLDSNWIWSEGVEGRGDPRFQADFGKIPSAAGANEWLVPEA